LLYACANTSPNTSGAKSGLGKIEEVEGNYMLVSYLIDEAGADPNITNDILQNALLLSTQRNQLNIVDLLF
jgi:ankyrin repeat protein